MNIEVIRTEGLGDSTYILEHDGEALVVDPQRDIDRFEMALNALGADLRFVLETHLHNDYVSGGRYLAGRLGGELVLPSGAAPVYRHRPAFHMEDMGSKSMTIRPIHTPGHTPEHTSYLIVIDELPVALFSGGSLLVGSAGRSDLLGPERADTLARLQYQSVNRLAELPEEVGLYPTHGAGSFCTTSGASSFTSTIGAEKATNPVLAYPTEDAFVQGQLTGLVPYPAYYSHMGPANVAGVPEAPSVELPMLQATELDSIRDEVTIIDARPKRDFADGHLAGSLAVELRDDFGVWVGWVVDFAEPLVLVMNPEQDSEEAMRQLIRIGFDDVRGVVRDLSPWSDQLLSHKIVDKGDFAEAVSRGAQVLDVRAPNEWAEGVISNSVRRYVPDLVGVNLPDVDPADEVWMACGTGYRANIVASMATTAGYRPVVLIDAGVTEVLEELSNRGWEEWCDPAPARA